MKSYSLDAIQHALSRSRLAVRLATKLRNQCNCVIGYSVTATSDPERNGERWLAGRAGPGCRTFVDVGANVGNWTQMFLSYVATGGRGVLFEPAQSAHERLIKTVPPERVEVIQAAVGERSGRVEFAEEPGAGETSSAVSGVSVSTAVRRTVPLTTLDDEMARREWSVVDFLKIDTEGYDLNVLTGASGLLADRRVKVIQFEYNSSWAPAGATLTRAKSLLVGSGYRVFALRPDGLTEPDPRHGEYFQYSNYVALSPDGEALMAGAVPQPR